MEHQVSDEQFAMVATQRWLERAVIGLNLCPFAHGVHAKQRIRWVVSQADDEGALRDELDRELIGLTHVDASITETTLLIVPHLLGNFLQFTQFLRVAERRVKSLKLTGVIQLASFHPDYQFADAEPEDMSNYSNRSPYPTLHLLREDSIDRAVQVMPDTAQIYRTNIETLRRLGLEGWQRLGIDSIIKARR